VLLGEALILGPNINVPMAPEANAPALEALAKAGALKDKATPRERALIEALEKRYAPKPKADRAPLDAAYRRCDEGRRRAASRTTDDRDARRRGRDGHPAVGLLGGRRRKAKGRGDYRRDARARAQARTAHPGAIHLYIHAIEASTTPEKRAALREPLAR
jgi:hypothetical protein